MPGGSTWCTEPPTLRNVPQDLLWHVYNRSYGPLAPNPESTARMALVGTHAMFYAADTIDGALWESVLRNVHVNKGQATILPAYLDGFSLISFRARRTDLPLLELGQPGLRRLFPDPDSRPAQAVADLLRDPVHKNTHADAQALHIDLATVGITEMPTLAWPSRMHNAGTVYLAYAPPMIEDWWEIDSLPIPLDTPGGGHPVIDEVLVRQGFTRALPIALRDRQAPLGERNVR